MRTIATYLAIATYMSAPVADADCIYLLSAADIAIVRARPVADLDIILWYSQGSQRVYTGNETRIANGSARDYNLLATGLDECESSYLGKTRVFDTKCLLVAEMR